jgi:hypothetical protein
MDQVEIKEELDSYVDRLLAFDDPMTRLTLLHSHMKVMGVEMDKRVYKVNVMAWLVSMPQYRRETFWNINLEADSLLARVGIR